MIVWRQAVRRRRAAGRAAGWSAGRAAGWVVVLACALVVISGPDARAHSAEGSPSSNFRTEIVGIRPEPTAFRFRVIEAGSRLEVRHLTGEPLVVLGYDGEPYLRVGPDGVDNNLQSPSTYINRTRDRLEAVPDGVDPANPPRWERVSDEPVARWHDHRAHWMGSQRPDTVAAAPDRIQRIQDWETVVVQGDVRYTVSGTLDWVPGPSGRPKLAVGAIVGAVPIVAALFARNERRRRVSAVALVGVMLAGLIAIDVVHLVGIVTGVEGSGLLGRVVSVGYASIAAWVLGAVAIVLLLRRRIDALYLVTFSAGLIALVGGLADIGSLSASSIPFAFDPEVARWTIAVSLCGGIGVAIAAVLLTRPVGRGSGGRTVRRPSDLDDLELEPGASPNPTAAP